MTMISNRYATVTVTEEHGTDNGDQVVIRYVVTSSTGYRAELPACPCERTPCPIRVAFNAGRRHSMPKGQSWTTHDRTHCHGWHAGMVDRFAADVLATYGTGSARPRDRKSGVSRGSALPWPGYLDALVPVEGWPEPDGPHAAPDVWRVEHIADALGMTVEQYRAELGKASA